MASVSLKHIYKKYPGGVTAVSGSIGGPGTKQRLQSTAPLALRSRFSSRSSF